MFIMAHPRKLTVLTVADKGALNLLSYGWVSVAEAARMLGVNRSTMLRMCASAGIDPQAARQTYLRRLHLAITRYGHRRMTKADMTARAAVLMARHEI